MAARKNAAPDSRQIGPDVTGIDELGGLVRQLHETQLRLHELSDGELDFVRHPDGQSYLLHHAQERLRENEAAQRHFAETQSSILNALPAHIALIDHEGVIISVNDGWRHFAEGNGLQDSNSTLGQNYLEVCEQATGDCSGEAHAAAAGIRRVLCGEEKEFAIEYPCHSSTEKRWFRLMVTQLCGDRLTGAVVMHVNITERRLAEEAMRESNEKFHQLANTITDAFWIRSSDMSQVHYLSPAFERIWGRSVEELTENPQKWIDLIFPEERARVLQSFDALSKETPTMDIEYRIVRPDGEIRWVRVRGFQIRDAGGQLIRLSGVASDITDRKQAEAALVETSSLLQALLENTDDQIYFKDLQSRMVHFSKMFLARLHLTDPGQLRGRTDFDFYTEEHARPAFEAEQEIIRTGKSIINLEEKETHRDGRITWALTSKMPWRDPQGKLLGTMGISRDITDRKLAEERIAEQAELIDEARDAIIVRDLEHRISFWSKGAGRLYGWTAEEACGHLMHDLLGMPVDKFTEADLTVRKTGQWNGEIQNGAKNGARLTLDCRWTLLRDARGEPRSILSIDTDITERKKLEHQFLRSQRMESIGTLAGGIAHDLNNSLAPIIMSLELLKMKFTDPSSQELLGIIGASAERGSDMVRQVLSFARGVEGQRIEVQVRHLIKDIEKIANETFLKHVQVRTIIPNDLWAILGDPTQLHQVLLNLCVNARDAMPDGGTLALSAENVTLDEHYAGMNLEARTGPHVFLQVEDTGTGMPPEVMEKIFDPFFTTKEIGKGTGLGLSTTLAIIKSHGGFIRVYSELGKGTRFKIYLPALTEVSAEMAAEIAAEMPRGNGELILVVDDEASVRQITQQTLEAFGYSVILAGDGSEALAIYATRQAEIAAVLTDMMMPVMEGSATIQVLRKLNPTLPIIAASGLSSNAHVASLGVQHFLPKPYTADKLLKALKEVITGKH